MNDKKTLIMDAAIRLFAEDGVGVPTAKIAKEAGVSNGTLFNYFESKQILIEGVCLYVIERMAHEIIGDFDPDADIKEMFSHSWRAYIRWAQNNPLEHKVLGLLKYSQILGEETEQKIDSFFEPFNKATERAVKDKIMIDIPLELMSRMACAYMDAVIAYIREYKLNKSEITDIIEKSFQMHWKGISV